MTFPFVGGSNEYTSDILCSFFLYISLFLCLSSATDEQICMHARARCREEEEEALLLFGKWGNLEKVSSFLSRRTRITRKREEEALAFSFFLWWRRLFRASSSFVRSFVRSSLLLSRVEERKKKKKNTNGFAAGFTSRLREGGGGRGEEEQTIPSLRREREQRSRRRRDLLERKAQANRVHAGRGAIADGEGCHRTDD